MEIRYTLHFHPKVIKEDLPKTDAKWRAVIRDAIREKLQTEPEFYGKPLRQDLKGYRKLRVGEYRVVFYIKQKGVYILAVQHRSVIYKTAPKRKGT